MPVTLALNVEKRKVPEGLGSESQSVTAKGGFILQKGGPRLGEIKQGLLAPLAGR